MAADNGSVYLWTLDGRYVVPPDDSYLHPQIDAKWLFSLYYAVAASINISIDHVSVSLKIANI